MSSLCQRLSAEGELVTFSDSEPIQALQAILEMRPPLIVLERLFAATPRGAALINRIKTDPQLSGSDVRVMSHTGDYVRQVARAAAQPTMAAMAAVGIADVQPAPLVHHAPPVIEAPRPLDW